MQWYWWLLEFSANLVEAIMLVVFIQQFSEPRFKSRWPFVVSILVVFAMITVNNRLDSPSWANILFYVGIGVVLGLAIFKGSVISRLLLPMIMMALILVAEVVAMGVLRLVFGNSDINFSGQTQYRMLGIIISKVLLIVLVYLAGRFSKKEDYKIPLGYSLCLLLVPLISIVGMLTIGQYIFPTYGAKLSPLWFAFSAFGLLFLNLLIIYLFEALTNYSRNQSRLQLMVQQTDMLNNHLRETNALQEETQKIWHDMKNHFTVIQWMVKSHSYEKLEQYMNTLNDTVAATMPKIQSGNPLLDALLNTKAVEAKNYGIELMVSAAVPAKLAIDDLDLNIVFSNALDNAIDACKKLPAGQERFVDISASIKNDHMVLTVRNPYDGIIKKSGDTLQTTKEEDGRHGIGMGNMKRAVEKYDGHIMTNYADNLFILSAIMHCSI